MKIRGLALPFMTQNYDTEDADDLVLPTALDAQMRDGSHVALITCTHDVDIATEIACTGNGLKLFTDKSGLWFEASLPDTAPSFAILTSFRNGADQASVEYDRNEYTTEADQHGRLVRIVSGRRIRHICIVMSTAAYGDFTCVWSPDFPMRKRAEKFAERFDDALASWQRRSIKSAAPTRTPAKAMALGVPMQMSVSAAVAMGAYDVRKIPEGAQRLMGLIP